MKGSIFIFIFAMWILILIGGEIAVVVLGPLSITGFGDFDQLLSSGIKAVIAIAMVILWIFVLSKMKNWMFKKKIKT